jgi:hypothetical protein
MIKNFFKRITGIAAIEAAKQQAIEEAKKMKEAAEEDARLAIQRAHEAKVQEETAKVQEEKAKEAERLAKLTPKERATELKQPYIEVLNTHVNKENVKNGFFELDWNEYFVVQLTEAGYRGDSEESIVDQWFQDLCRNIGAEEGVSMDRRGSGYINVNNLGNGKSEIS